MIARLDLLRREIGSTVEFVTIMWFESLDAVRAPHWLSSTPPIGPAK